MLTGDQKSKITIQSLSECTILTVTELKPARDRPNWGLINHINHLAILSHSFLLHKVLIFGPLGYEPNTLPLRNGADARALSDLTTVAWQNHVRLCYESCFSFLFGKEKMGWQKILCRCRQETHLALFSGLPKVPRVTLTVRQSSQTPQPKRLIPPTTDCLGTQLHCHPVPQQNCNINVLCWSAQLTGVELVQALPWFMLIFSSDQRIRVSGVACELLWCSSSHPFSWYVLM